MSYIPDLLRGGSAQYSSARFQDLADNSFFLMDTSN